ncbi:hypothetical protein R1flu_012241 [Riccia fluitans]|uniref:Uncharacterized protein n=1 Tax=Riccia fluitans TaxID=41844 RepID=A0ABD1ZA33_9MARC
MEQKAGIDNDCQPSGSGSTLGLASSFGPSEGAPPEVHRRTEPDGCPSVERHEQILLRSLVGFLALESGGLPAWHQPVDPWDVAAAGGGGTVGDCQARRVQTQPRTYVHRSRRLRKEGKGKDGEKIKSSGKVTGREDKNIRIGDLRKLTNRAGRGAAAENNRRQQAKPSKQASSKKARYTEKEELEEKEEETGGEERRGAAVGGGGVIEEERREEERREGRRGRREEQEVEESRKGGLQLTGSFYEEEEQEQLAVVYICVERRKRSSEVREWEVCIISCLAHGTASRIKLPHHSQQQQLGLLLLRSSSKREASL